MDCRALLVLIFLGLFASGGGGFTWAENLSNGAVMNTPSMDNISPTTDPIRFTVGSTGQVVSLPVRSPQVAKAVTLPMATGLNALQKQQLREALESYQARRYAQAEKDLLALCRQVPKLGAMQALLGEFYISQKQYGRAIQAYEKAMQATPRQLYADQLALLYFTDGQSSGQWQGLERYAQKNPHSGLTHHLLGVRYQQAGDPVRSLAAFEQSARLQPDLPDAHYNLACVYESLGLLTDARQHYWQTLQLQPNAPDARLALARVEKRQQQLAAEKAKQVAEQINQASQPTGNAAVTLSNTAAPQPVALPMLAIPLKQSQ